MILFDSASDAIDWIQGARYKGEKKGLDNCLALLDALGRPDRKYKCLHVAGTNGKGSVCALTERALRENGYRTGLYTSPYLMRYPERIRVNGAPIGDDDLIEIASLVREIAEKLVTQGICPTTFELGTAIAFEYFARQNVDYAVIEVGLGGRFDSTNVISPVACAITRISLDHTKVLGSTVGEIAFEKAGIVKPGIPVTTCRQEASALAAIEDTCTLRESCLYVADDFTVVSQDAAGSVICMDGKNIPVPLCGGHQTENAAVAYRMLTSLRNAGEKIDMDACIAGFSRAVWAGRLEWVGNTLIDGAHNPNGAASLADYLRTWFTGKKLVLLTGMMQDKQFLSCARILAPLMTHIVTTEVDFPRAASCGMLKSAFHLLGYESEAIRSIPEAYERAKILAGEDGYIICAGSLYLAGDVRLMLLPDDSGQM